eukprot:TRINITY_DN12299_c1_g1_i5.p1 TRINITY_DN12299_c1_g1~~TRINITY_DN12299_c1_g1_i5.p1  ORF type:complete len:153 (+),score=18.02 TRINITY_DN12299_c1_g1_i5:303-761(+)
MQFRRQSRLANRMGGRKVSLVGHSAGGWLARLFMAEFGPDDVELLLTLGTPHLLRRVVLIAEWLKSPKMQSQVVERINDFMPIIRKTYGSFGPSLECFLFVAATGIHTYRGSTSPPPPLLHVHLLLRICAIIQVVWCDNGLPWVEARKRQQW